MKKFRVWFINKFLPAYAQEIAQNEIKKRDMEISRLKNIIIQQQAELNGVYNCLRLNKKVVIKD